MRRSASSFVFLDKVGSDQKFDTKIRPENLTPFFFLPVSNGRKVNFTQMKTFGPFSLIVLVTFYLNNLLINRLHALIYEAKKQ